MIMSPLTVLDLDGCHLSLLYIQYRSLLALHQQCVGDRCLLLNPQIQFGTQHQNHTRTPYASSFANIYHHKKPFRGKGTMWWNSLPVNLTQCTPGDFMDSLFNFLIAG